MNTKVKYYLNYNVLFLQLLPFLNWETEQHILIDELWGNKVTLNIHGYYMVFTYFG